MFERFLHTNKPEDDSEAEKVAPKENQSQPQNADVDAKVPPFPTEDEKPEDALPVEEPASEEPAPEPPSFLKAEEEPQQSKSVNMVENKETEALPPKDPAAPRLKIGDPIPPKDPDPIQGKSLHDIEFADIWYTPEGIAYVRDQNTRFALVPIQTDDLEDFHAALEQGFTGMSSYAIRFAGDSYRVERVNTIDGLQYNCRKMPTKTPEIETLGFAPEVVKHLTSLSRASGLLLFAGPTGQGKTTTVSSLMKRYLDTDGGFLYTIEDPPEMPLSGIYHSKNGGLGLCKQVPVENDQWGAGLRSALRSKPRYILVGEIRTPETASQCLIAATSGHLVLSTIHANGVEDALNSLIKYAASTGLDNTLVADLWHVVFWASFIKGWKEPIN